MKFMLLIYGAENAWSESERNACYAESAQLARDLSLSGHYLGASPLKSVATATSVRVRDGKPIITDGPFAETKEVIAGYSIWEVKSMEEAIAWAKRCPLSDGAEIELRPIFCYSEDEVSEILSEAE